MSSSRQQLFNGSATTRRAINLGGSSTSNRSDSGFEDVVTRARKERELRELNRRREAAAIKIQVSGGLAFLPGATLPQAG